MTYNLGKKGIKTGKVHNNYSTEWTCTLKKSWGVAAHQARPSQEAPDLVQSSMNMSTSFPGHFFKPDKGESSAQPPGKWLELEIRDPQSQQLCHEELGFSLSCGETKQQIYRQKLNKKGSLGSEANPECNTIQNASSTAGKGKGNPTKQRNNPTSCFH